MRGWLVFMTTLAIVCAALAILLYRPLLQKGSEEPGSSKQCIASADVKEDTTVEVREGKVLVDGKPFPLAGEVVSVTVANGNVYMNGRCVSRGKAERLLLRAYPEGLRKLEQPGKESQELSLKRWEEVMLPPPPWLTEREKEEFKRDIQKWQRRFQERLQRQPAEQWERELDAREMLNELDRIHQQAEQLGRHLKELQQRSRAPGRPLEPLRSREEESTEKLLERHLEKLLEALERGEEFIRPRFEEFLKRVEKTLDKHIEKSFDRWLEKKLSEEGVMNKAMDRFIERMEKRMRAKESPLPRREQELKKPPRGSEEDF